MTLLTATGQDNRIKGIIFPFIEHSIGVEKLITKNISVQLLYQNRIIPGDNRYFHHNLIPSIRYYISSNKGLINLIYIELFYRYAYVKHFGDQSIEPYYKYYSNSIGVDIGKQIFLSKNFFMEFGVGYYYMYSGKEQYNHFEGDKNNLRIDLKVGIRLHCKKEKTSR